MTLARGAGTSRNDRELCRKDLLIKNLKRRRRLLAKKGHHEEDFNFWPTSFVLPSEYSMFVEEFKRSGGTWIMKPISKSQGKGIFLFRSLEEIDQWRNDVPGRSAGDVEAYIVQRYISHPLLIGGKKFDMRLYALVTSWSPLVVWIYRSGFCRFSSTAYSSTELDNMVAHLTNVAVQKKSSTYDPDSGGKWEIRQLKLFLMSRHGLSTVDAAFEAVQRIIIQSLEAVQPVMIQDRHCFELYGYDILFDQELKPWLLEVNGAPSLTANTPEDRRMKCDMLSSLLDVVDMEKRRTVSVASGGLLYLAQSLPHALHRAAKLGSEALILRTTVTSQIGRLKSPPPRHSFQSWRGGQQPHKQSLGGPSTSGRTPNSIRSERRRSFLDTTRRSATAQESRGIEQKGAGVAGTAAVAATAVAGCRLGASWERRSPAHRRRFDSLGHFTALGRYPRWSKTPETGLISNVSFWSFALNCSFGSSCAVAALYQGDSTSGKTSVLLRLRQWQQETQHANAYIQQQFSVSTSERQQQNCR